MATLSFVPPYPAPNRKTSITVTLTSAVDDADANWARIWVTDAPPGSELRSKLDDSKDPRRRFQVYEGEGGTDAKWNITFDKGGPYTLLIEEWIKGSSAFGGGYQGDPNGGQEETLAASDTAIVHIGQRMTSSIRAGSNELTLALWCWDSTIRRTTVEVHGEDSPALQKETPSARERAAMESAAVQSALDELVDQSVTTAMGDPSTLLGPADTSGRFVKEWNDHLADAAAHEDADADNLIPNGLGSAVNADNLAERINTILNYIRQHYQNDAVLGGVDAGIDSGNYHNVASGKANDTLNMPIIQGASTPSDGYWAIADLWRSYEAHRVSTGVHDSADSTNALTTLPKLLEVGKQVLTVWASTAPTVPSTQSTGAMRLIATAGFSESPLE